MVSGPGPVKQMAPYIGIGLVLGAQLFQATMLVVEEKFLGKSSRRLASSRSRKLPIFFELKIVKIHFSYFYHKAI